MVLDVYGNRKCDGIVVDREVEEGQATMAVDDLAT